MAGEEEAEVERADVVVVGAGPAGIAGALAACASGASVVLVDEYPAPGGQIWRRSHRDAGAAAPASVAPEGRAALAALAASPARVLAGASVWGVAEARTVLIEDAAGRARVLRAGALVVATGAHDRPVAFPGWTLPGVVTAGAAQALVKGQGVLPGRRVLLAGAGPFLLPVAAELAAAGAQVVAVAEATRRRAWLAAAPRAARRPDRLAEYAAYRRALRAAGVPYLWGHAIARAEGADAVQSAALAPVDGGWRPRGPERRFAVDAVCTAYGFLPTLELPRALGCALRTGAEAPARFVAHDADMGTSVPGVFAAGEATGIGGAELARVEGALAGRSAARWAGHQPSPGDEGALRRRHARAAGFAALLDTLFAPRPGLHELAAPDTVLCRCEDVSAGAVAAAVAAGARSLPALKIATRCGQGPCQGRMCEALVAHAVERAGGDATEPFGARPPLRPVALATLADAGAALTARTS